MIVTRNFLDQTWTDLHAPTQEELGGLISQQNIDPSVAKDLLTPTPKQYAKGFGDSIYAVIHLPFFRHSDLVNLEQEIDFLISEKKLLTTHYESIDALHHFAKEVEVNEILNKGSHTHLFFGLMREIYDFLFDDVEYFKDWLRETEKNIFSGYEKDMVLNISVASRNVLSFKRIVFPHKEVLETILEISRNNFSQEFRREMNLLIKDWENLMNEINNISDMLDELRETNDSLLSAKQNDIMKQLAVFGSVILPLTLIGQIFGLSILSFPLKDSPHAFWAILGIMGSVMLCSLLYARFKKWM